MYNFQNIPIKKLTPEKNISIGVFCNYIKEKKKKDHGCFRTKIYQSVSFVIVKEIEQI